MAWERPSQGLKYYNMNEYVHIFVLLKTSPGASAPVHDLI